MDGVQVNGDGTNEAIQNMGELELDFIPAERYPLDDGTVLLRLSTEEMAHLKSMTPRLSIALAEPEPLAGRELESAIGELIGKIDVFVNDSENFLCALANGSSIA